MNQATATIAILAGALVGGGLFLLVGFFMGVDMLPDRPGSSGSLRDSLKGLSGRLIASLVVGLGVLLLTRWIVLAVAAAPVLREDLALLADRMRVRVPLPTALRQFADDLDDPTADLIVSALIMNARLRGPGLRQLLSALADTARSELDMRQRVSASRAGTRRSAQIVVIFSIVVMLGLAVFNRSFVAPYSSVQGQLVLLVVVALFAVGMLWMRRLAGVQLPRRFLTVSTHVGGGNA